MKPLLKKATGQPWAISQAGLSKMMTLDLPDAMQSKLATFESAQADELREWFSMLFNQRQPMEVNDGIALIHAYGPMMDDAAPFDLAMGATGYEEITRDIQQANEQGAKAIILVANTPGGTVSGIKETVASMEASDVPIYGYNAGSATSAGYYLLAGAEKIGAAPSSISGNVGTVLAWHDDTKFLESLGIEYHVMVNDGADLKGTFRDSPMSDSQREFLQSNLNSMGDEFFDHVSANRPDVTDEIKRAGWYGTDQAADMGLIDMEGSLSEFIAMVNQSLDIQGKKLA